MLLNGIAWYPFLQFEGSSFMQTILPNITIQAVALSKLRRNIISSQVCRFVDRFLLHLIYKCLAYRISLQQVSIHCEVVALEDTQWKEQ
ncbi:uncharacterized protein LOC125422995 isoform X2 [Ziziphus jujuba]|uniref:Uncharacterized protein LOC125422995 isoform X2 n=1 Tax=Ziziphus jujuba TaxID=326968 RepID=A0ABM3IMR6_ZIZJJ|nr:uncharacterized protein LOC125422995 isoform X2 [Ziziphus jujuba]